MPRVSIIVLTHNRSRFLREALDSALSQTFGDFEIIISDDASTDDTPRVCAEYQARDHRIKYFRNEKNLYLVKNRAQTAKRASGEYIATLDDDDVWADPEKLEKQVKFLDENPNYVICGTSAIVVNPGGKELYRFYNPEGDQEIRSFMHFRNPFLASSVLYRRSALEKVNGYRTDLAGGDDYDLWFRMGTTGKMQNLPFYGIKYGLVLKNPHKLLNMGELLRMNKRYRRYYPNYYKALLVNSAKFAGYAAFYRFPFIENFVLRIRYKYKLRF